MSKQIINFKKEALEALPILENQYDVSDSKITALYLRVNPGGTKTYNLYRKVNGRIQRIKIGRYTDLTIEQARKEAIRLNSLIALGSNPAEERKAARLESTFKELFSFYYEEHALRHTKRPEDNKKIIEYHAFSAIGNYKLSEITQEKMRKLHAEIGEKRGRAIANRVIHIINAIFNFALKEGYFKGINPCFGIKKFRIASRDRFLSRDELKSFFDALQHEKPIFHDFFAMALYTGGRKSNVLSMRWNDIDFDIKRWRIPETHTKNRDVNIVLLSSAAIDILKQRYEANLEREIPSTFVFPGDNSYVPLKDPKKSFARIKDRMNVHDIRIHDLRRTLGSYMAISGASLTIIGAALNHKSTDSTEIYARLTQDPVRNAIDNATIIMGV